MKTFVLSLVRVLALTCLMLLCSLTASAYGFSAANGDSVTIYYNITSFANKTVAVTYGESEPHTYTEESLVIPGTVSPAAPQKGVDIVH